MTLDEAKEYLEETLKEDIQLLSPRDRVTLYFNMMEFFTPKRQRTSIDPNIQNIPDDIYDT